MSLGALVTIVLPVFGFIAVGYLVIVVRLLPAERAPAIADFTFALAIPVLLFKSIGTLELPDVSPWRYWSAYFAAAFVVMAIGMVITEKVFGRDARAGVIGGMCAAFANTVMVGVPTMAIAFGDEGLVTGFLLVGLHLPLMMMLSAILIEVAEFRDGGPTASVHVAKAVRRVALGLLRSPLVLAILAGLAFRATGLPLEGVPRTIIDRIGDTAIPLALISLGMTLHGYGIRGNIKPAATLGIVKLLVLPGLVYLSATYVFRLNELATAGAVILAASPTGANAYLIAGRFQTGLALAANTITLTTPFALITMTLWLAVLGV